MMILFLIETYLLGWAIASFFREKVSALFLAFLAVLLGLFGFFINVVVLTLFNVHLSAWLLAILMGGELVLLILIKWLISGKRFFKFNWTDLWYVVAGTLFTVGCWIFSLSGPIFATTDSLYLIIMGRNILETGFLEWYFASPLQWGVFVPVLQILGMLFGHDYTWFVQPVISFTFLILFAFVLYKANHKISSQKFLPIMLTILGMGLLVSSRLYWIAQFYIHTNLDTAISLFLVITSLYFVIRDEEEGWLGIAGIFILLLSMIRIENVILAVLIIVLTIATREIAHKKLLWTFLPYLIFQIIFNLAMIMISPAGFSDLLSMSQLKLVTIGLIGLVVFLVLAGHPTVQKKLIKKLNLIVVIGISAALLGVVFLRPEKIFLDTWDNLLTMFGTGQWFATFWGCMLLLLLVKTKDKNTVVYFMNIFIFAFFSMIIILGYFKGNYHSAWYDSANRMYIHILPIILFYLSIKISSNHSLLGATEQIQK